MTKAIKTKIYLLFVFTLMIAPKSHSQTDLSCVLAKPFIFGASISAGYKNMIDGALGIGYAKIGQVDLLPTLKRIGKEEWLPVLETIVKNRRRPKGGNPGPFTRLARKHNPETQITNVSEIVNEMEFSAVGYYQFFDYFHKEDNSALTEASIFASLDSLYWPTVYTIDEPFICDESIGATQQIIDYAHSLGTPLVLATVPDEDPEKVNFILRGGNLLGLKLPPNWFKPNTACLEKVNAFLRKSCKADQGCVLIDIYNIVQDLRGTELIMQKRKESDLSYAPELDPHPDPAGIIFNGKHYTYNDTRGDGVHVNGLFSIPFLDRLIAPIGNRYIMSFVESQLLKANLSCKQSK